MVEDKEDSSVKVSWENGSRAANSTKAAKIWRKVSLKKRPLDFIP